MIYIYDLVGCDSDLIYQNRVSKSGGIYFIPFPKHIPVYMGICLDVCKGTVLMTTTLCWIIYISYCEVLCSLEKAK